MLLNLPLRLALPPLLRPLGLLLSPSPFLIFLLFLFFAPSCLLLLLSALSLLFLAAFPIAALFLRVPLG